MTYTKSTIATNSFSDTVTSLLDLADDITDSNPDLEVLFVPCYSDPKHDNKKLPCSKSWKEGHSASELQNYDRMTILSVLLGDRLLSLDMDDQGAVDFIKTVFTEINYDPTQTMVVTRANACNGSYTFFLPEGVTIPYFTYTKGNIKLEIRTGAHYQAVGGRHPSGALYQNNGSSIEEIPPILLERILAWYGNRSQDVVGTHLSSGDIARGEKTLTDFDEWSTDDLRHILKFLADHELCPFDGGGYSNWINELGMIINHHQPGDDGFRLWQQQTEILEAKYPADHDHRFRDAEVREKWNSFGGKENPKTVGTWIARVQAKIADLEAGICPPARNSEEEYLPGGRKVRVGAKIKELVGKWTEPEVPAMPYSVWFRSRFELERTGGSSDRDSWLEETYRRYKGAGTDFKTTADIEEELDELLDFAAISAEDFVQKDDINSEELKQIWAMIEPGGLIPSVCRTMQLDSYTALQCLLTACSILMPKGKLFKVTHMYKNPGTKFLVLYGATSSGKDVIINKFIDPISQLDEDAGKTFKAQKKRYNVIASLSKGMGESDIQNIKNTLESFPNAAARTEFLEGYRGGKGSLEGELRGNKESLIDQFWRNCPSDLELDDFQIPIQKHYLVTEASPQAARNLAVMSAYPIGWVSGEGESIFNSTQNIDGRGAGQPNLFIHGWNHDRYKGFKVENTDTELMREPLSGYYQFSLLAAIQPKFLPKLLTIDDEKGETARFDFVNAEKSNLEIIKMNNILAKKASEDMHAFLTELYSKIDLLRNRITSEITITEEASDLWVDYAIKLKAIALLEESEAYKKWLLKLAQKTAHEIAIIHVMRWAQYELGLSSVAVDPQIQDTISVKAAIAIAELSRESTKEFFTSFLAPTLTGHAKWIFEHLQRIEKPKTVRDLYTHPYAKSCKLNAKTVRQLLYALTDKGLLETQETNGKTMWKAIDKLAGSPRSIA